MLQRLEDLVVPVTRDFEGAPLGLCSQLGVLVRGDLNPVLVGDGGAEERDDLPVGERDGHLERRCEVDGARCCDILGVEAREHRRRRRQGVSIFGLAARRNAVEAEGVIRRIEPMQREHRARGRFEFDALNERNRHIDQARIDPEPGLGFHGDRRLHAVGAILALAPHEVPVARGLAHDHPTLAAGRQHRNLGAGCSGIDRVLDTDRREPRRIGGLRLHDPGIAKRHEQLAQLRHIRGVVGTFRHRPLLTGLVQRQRGCRAALAHRHGRDRVQVVGQGRQQREARGLTRRIALRTHEEGSRDGHERHHHQEHEAPRVHRELDSAGDSRV